MKILLIGFQRSGTTLLRRIVELHPEVRRVFHEQFLLRRYPSLERLQRHFQDIKISINKQNWGEKVPYYPSARGIPIIKYCETWKNYFGNEGRIIHIVRHPYDVAFSVVAKYKNINDVLRPLKIYRGIIPTAVQEIENLGITKTIKYEDLLLDPDKVLPSVYDFCGLDPNFDFKSAMLKIENKKYQTFDSSRVFAYKNKKIVAPKRMDLTIEFLNTFGDSKYEL